MQRYLKLSFLLLFLSLTHNVFAQSVNFQDGFEDGNFTQNPVWNGDTAGFNVVDDTPNYLLHLDTTGTGTSYLSTPSTSVNGYWEFYIDFRGFEPSGSNQANIFLMSTTDSLSGPVNGYAVQVGESGDDVFHLVRYDNGNNASTILSDTTVIDGDGGGYTVRVSRDTNGNWQMKVGKGYGGPLYNSGNTGTDNTYTTSSYFGTKVDYTSSRANKFYFDFKIDLPPLTITNATANGDHVDVIFDRPPDQSTVSPTDFSINHGIGSPASISFPSTNVARLQYGSALPSNKYTVTAQNIQDQSGNAISGNAAASFIVYETYADGDVIINEFMYDPPSGQSEYVELKNLSDKYLNLQNWQVGDDSHLASISTDSVTLAPNEYLVISSDTTALFNTYSTRPYVQSPDAPSLNNGGDVVRILTDDSAQVDSLQYDPNWGGSKVSLERRSDTAPPIKANFGDSPNALGGTPGLANQVTKDQTPPGLVNLNITDNQTLDLYFLERLANGPATNANNYSLNNGITVSSARQTAADSVRLNLSTPLQNGTSYQLTIQNQQDIFGNAASSIDTSFSYFVVSPPDSGDVFINEFSYDPPTGSTEYVELYNTSSKSLDLNGWTINDNTGNRKTITHNRFVIPPDSFAVLAPDRSLLTNHRGINLISLGSNLPSLNNSGDAIVIRDSTGERLDSLTYTPSIGGSKMAVERRSTQAPPVQANFGDAPNGFGTPGAANQVEKDTTPPSLHNFTILSAQSLQFVFSETVTKQTATNTAHYKLSGSPAIQSASLAGGDTVRVQLSGALQNNTQYTAIIDGVEDIFGNAITNRDTTFTFLKTSQADSSDVFINEFTYDPPDGSTEYVELYNPSSKSLDLQNWTINDNTGHRNIITNSQHIIPPDSYVVLAPDNTLQSDYPNIDLVALGSRFPSLNNGGDNIVIRRGNGLLLDSLTYTPAFGGSNKAVERRTTQAPPVQANFGDAPNGFGTPGAPNQIGKDTTPPDLTKLAVLDNQTLRLAFSEGLNKNEASDASNYSLNNGINISNARQIARDSVQLHLASPLQNGTKYKLNINNQQDIFGNTASKIDTTFKYFQPSPADSGDVFINEFTYDPPTGSTEYVELYNPSSKSLDLQNWSINDNTGHRNTIIDSQHIIPPGSYVVLAPDNTLQADYPDIDLLALGSRFPSLNNSGDAIVIRNTAGQRLDSLTYTPAFGGDTVAVERRSIHAPPVQANFGDAPNGFGTPGSANQIGQDTTPPDLTNFAIPGNQTVTLAFSETLDKQSATTASNYSLNHNIKVSRAQQTAGDSVRLSLASPLQNDTKYKLTISKQQDIFGNTAAEIDTSFTYFQLSKADSGDVFINEFTYDPPTGSTEYVELYNPSNKSLNLNGWTLNDNTAKRQTVISSRFVIPPNSYVVLAPDRTVQNDRPDIKLIPMGSRFPSLNNSGDNIVLRRADGTQLDSLTYTPAFGGNNVAVERRTTEAPPIQANFGPAPNGFGTPGAPNQIAQDNTPPSLKSFNIVNNTTLQLIFSEAITPKSATNQNNYSLSPDPGIHLISSDQDTVNLFLSQQLQTGNNYKVTVSGVQDVFGNTSSSTSSLSATYLVYSAGQPKDVVINEFLYRPKEAGDPEFVELYNRTDRNFDLSGWKLGDASAPVTINTNAKLKGGDYIVLTDVKSFADQLPNGVYLSNFPALNDDGDAIYIKNDKDVTIDSLFYSPQFGGNIDGKSAERKDPKAASNDPANYATSTASSGSTPDAKNSVFKRDKTPPEISSARILPDDNIEVNFSEFIKRSQDLTFVLNDEPLDIVSFQSDEANTIILASSNSIPTDAKLKLQVKNLTDISGNTTDATSINIAQPIHKGSVVFNEILYDPINDSEDNKPDQSEYVELRNTKDYAVSLEGISLHDAPDEDGTVRTISAVTTQEKFIPARGTALIYAEDETPVFSESRIANFFNLTNIPSNRLLRADRSTLSLASSGDAIYLANKNGATIDSVFFDESWQNPNLASTKGVALERINPDGPSNNKSNWSSSTSELGGTPDQENSIFEKPDAVNQQKIGIDISPNPFSPDGDNRDPVTYINYKLEESDYLITIDIYDRYGREVRQLVDGKQAGFKGSIPWNGLKDNDTRNRIGIYIVIFKAFDSARGKDKAFKKTVVLARKLN